MLRTRGRIRRQTLHQRHRLRVLGPHHRTGGGCSGPPPKIRPPDCHLGVLLVAYTQMSNQSMNLLFSLNNIE
jgi:hypothetical protein